MSRTILSTAVWLIVAGGLQLALRQKMAIWWAAPDFVLVVAVVLSMHRSSDAAAFTGFFAGLMHSAILNSDLAALTISRMAASVLAVRLHAAFLGAGVLSTSLLVASCTVAAGLVSLLLGGAQNIGSHAADTIGSAIYNGVIAIPTYALYRQFASAGSRV
jgi:hypothetical protein